MYLEQQPGRTITNYGIGTTCANLTNHPVEAGKRSNRQHVCDAALNDFRPSRDRRRKEQGLV
eukprot:6187849-Pleurochrysis_carterae.AAC.1